jgi:hypothetical protein
LAQRTSQLTAATYGARARNALHGLVFYTMPTAPGPLAFLDVARGTPIPNSPSRPCARSTPRTRPTPSAESTSTRSTLGVTYAIRPVGIDDAIVVTMTWAALPYGERLAAMADAMARSVRVTLP